MFQGLNHSSPTSISSLGVSDRGLVGEFVDCNIFRKLFEIVLCDRRGLVSNHLRKPVVSGV